jgi:hypothetical protein
MKKLFVTGLALESIANIFSPYVMIANANPNFDVQAYNHDLRQIPIYCSQQTQNRYQYKVCEQQMFQRIEAFRLNGGYDIRPRPPIRDPAPPKVDPCDNPLVPTPICN